MSEQRRVSAVRDRFRAWSTDPIAVTVLTGAVLILAGLAAVAASWRGVARTLDVQAQLAFLVSGGLGGIALVIAGAAVVLAGTLRAAGTAERAALERAITAAASIAEVARQRRS